MIRNDTIDLFGHVAVKTPQPSFDLPDRYVQFCCRKSPGQDRIGIALHKNHARWLAKEDSLDTDQDRGSLCTLGPGPGIKIMHWLGKVKLFEKNPVHGIGIVLTGMEYLVR